MSVYHFTCTHFTLYYYVTSAHHEDRNAVKMATDDEKQSERKFMEWSQILVKQANLVSPGSHDLKPWNFTVRERRMDCRKLYGDRNSFPSQPVPALLPQMSVHI